MAASASSPFLAGECRRFLLTLDQLVGALRNRAAGLDPGAGAPPSDPGALRDRLAAPLQDLPGAARQASFDGPSADLECTQHLLARLADATLADLAPDGRAAPAPLSDDFPLPEGVPEGLDEQIDRLLAAPRPSAALGEVYLLVLAAGLDGTEPDPSGLTERRQGLAALVAEARPAVSAAEGVPLFPAAYPGGTARVRPSYLPDNRAWLTLLLIALTLLLVASLAVWRDATRGLHEILQRILQHLA